MGEDLRNHLTVARERAWLPGFHDVAYDGRELGFGFVDPHLFQNMV